MSANLLGKNKVLYLFDDESGENGTYLVVGCLTSNGINRTANFNEGTKTKCDLTPPSVPQGVTYEITFEAVAIEDENTKVTLDRIEEIMNESHDNNTPVFWKEVTTDSSNAVLKTRFGKANITQLNDTASVDGEVTFSGTLQGVGKISATDLNV